MNRPLKRPNPHRNASPPADSTAHGGPDFDELGTPGADRSEEQDTEERIQILDLDTKNPIILYKNQTFSCQWTSTIGTDLILISPESGCSFPKLLEGDGFDILATTNIKIVGRPVQLVPRYEAIVTQTTEPPPEPICKEPDIQSTTAGEPVAEAPIRIPVGPESGRARHNQARFLERLMAAKSAKGDTDIIPLHPRKKQTGSGWRSWQPPADDNADAAVECRDGQESGVADEEDSEGEYQYRQDSSDRTVTSTPQQSPRGMRTGSRGVGRPRGGRKRAQTRARAIGGLFRDYRPHAGDADGADIRGIPDSTPMTWGELGRPVPTVTTHTTTAGAGTVTGAGGEGNGEGEGEVRQGDTAMADA